MNRLTSSLGVALASVFAVSFYAYGQLGGADGVRIPFTGLLERDGVTQSGLFDFRFSVYNAATGGSCDTHEETTLVSDGRFSVVLGPVAEACVRGKDVYVGIEVSDDEAVNGYTALPGRQRVYSASSAVSSGSGDFAVEGTLIVGGSLSMMAGSVIEMGERIDLHRVGGNADYDARLHVTGVDTLQIAGADVSLVPGPAGYGGTGSLSASGNLSATNNITAANDLSAGGELDVPANTWSANESKSVTIPPADFGDDNDGHVLTTCPNGKYVAGIWTKHYQEGGQFRDRYVTTLYCSGL